jgi:tRNA modification GTPase
MKAAADTIFALSSGHGRAGIAMLRVSGAHSHTVASGLSGLILEPRLATLAKLHNAQGELLDEAVLIYFKGPHSFTGEDVLEIHTHGSPAVIKAVLAALSDIKNCRPAQPGEFTKRAFLNGKMDLTEVEGLSDLLAADTDMQRRAALRETLGESRSLFTHWRKDLLQAIAFIEALIDFSADEDIPEEALDDSAQLLSALLSEMWTYLEKAQSSEILRDGLSIVLAGPPNAGKSSLLNALSKRDVAIVTDEPGTTRDLIEVRLDLSGYPVTLVDTAGLRESFNKVEEEGIRRAQKRSIESDLVLWLQPSDAAEENPPEEISKNAKLWIVRSKADLNPKAANKNDILVSAKTGLGIETLIEKLTAFSCKKFEGETDSVIFMRERHRQLLQEVNDKLKNVIAHLKTAPLEISAHELREATEPLERIMGFIGAEEMLGVIFERFCIGK